MLCCAKIMKKGLNIRRSKPCPCKAVIHRNGQPYCKRHDPVAKAARQKKALKKKTQALKKRIRLQIFLRYNKGKP